MSTLFTDFFVKINQISPLEHNFTEVLESIALKPKTLYFRGNLPQNMSKGGKRVRQKNVAIVGSRHNTEYGKEITYHLAYELAKRGVIIVSGLAYGIDTIAHRACLDAGGVTVAVLGTPIDQIYPRAHESVARRILEQKGAIISEYSPRTPEYINTPLAPGEAGFDGANWVNFVPVFDDSSASGEALPSSRLEFIRRRVDQKQSFLYRNRLISGLADIVVVAEAAERSGSLNTATHALEQGKMVFAVPGSITSPYSQGCNKLIKQGAFPYTEPDDILKELFPEDYVKKRRRLRRENLVGDTDVETKILQALAGGLRTGEEIMTATLFPPEVFNASITLLEIKGRIISHGANRWSLAG